VEGWGVFTKFFLKTHKTSTPFKEEGKEAYYYARTGHIFTINKKSLTASKAICITRSSYISWKEGTRLTVVLADVEGPPSPFSHVSV
jgi:hypothetical protein